MTVPLQVSVDVPEPPEIVFEERLHERLVEFDATASETVLV